ncbi:hypothetical protein [Pseudomonas indica]|uniref:hypothetical protein n=1 Tax=Pseudomonas indica TaxID=137658 RepID=UPI003FCF866B
MTSTETIDMRAESKARRARNKENSPRILMQHGIEFSVHNDGAHLIVRHGELKADFWPATGFYKARVPGSKHGRGVFNLIKELGSSGCGRESAAVDQR